MASVTTSLPEDELRKVSRFINERTRGLFRDFLVHEANLCPDCLSNLVQNDGARCCSQCGLVVDGGYDEHEFWIGDDHKPVNNLSYGRDLGGTLQLKGLWCVLAGGQYETGLPPDVRNNLPMRARHISIITRRLEHPKIEAMLRVGSELSNQCGFGEHRDIRSIQFSNLLGRVIRTVGAFVVAYNSRVAITNIAKACFLATFRYVSSTSEKPTPESLGISPVLFEAVCELYDLLSPLRRGY